MVSKLGVLWFCRINKAREVIWFWSSCGAEVGSWMEWISIRIDIDYGLAPEHRLVATKEAFKLIPIMTGRATTHYFSVYMTW